MRITMMAFPLMISAATLSMSAQRNPASDDFRGMRGANYVPSYARNDVQTWMDYDPAVIDRELGYAARMKLNTVRVFLQFAVYERDPKLFLERFESFLSLCGKHHIQMMPVVFDSCFGDFPDLERYREKDWMACPGQNRLGREHWPKLEKYVDDVVGTYKNDKRIVMWDVMNEPTCTSFNGEEDKRLIWAFLGHFLDYVKEQDPNHLRCVGFELSSLNKRFLDKLDVLAIHNYSGGLREDILAMKELARQSGKPVIVSEVAGRPGQPFDYVMPILREEGIGWCFWEMMLGKTQFSQGPIPYQGVIYPDGACHDAGEIAQIMNVSRAEASGLFPQRRWTAEQAWEWYRKQPWIVGFNYVPSTACNTTEFWSADTFDEKTIQRELGWAANLGFNSCRVFVQYLVWKHDPDGLKKRLDRFLSIGGKLGLSATLVLFDDCAFGDPPQTEPYLGKQRDPIPGMIAPSWTPSPGLKAVTDKSAWPDLERYVKDVVGLFGQDRRVLMWDLYNEPGNSGLGNDSRPLAEAAFAWARAMSPSQPLTMSPWGAPAEISSRQLELSDVVSFHFYGNYEGLCDQIARYKAQLRPVINTEWMARLQGSCWETDLPLFKKEAVGCYSWGLVNGRTQCQYAWYHERGTPEPKVWFHDLFHKDGRPYDPAEHEAIRKTTADRLINWSAADYSKPQAPKSPPAHTEDGIRFSDGWTRWTGQGPHKGRLHYANTAGATATWESKGTTAALVHKVGPDCGIARVLIDGKPAAVTEIDTYSSEVEWNHRTILAQDLPDGPHIVRVEVTGKKNQRSTDTYVQIVDTGRE